MDEIKSKIRDIQDFPKKGILFRDLTLPSRTPSPSTLSAPS